jgi:PhzF family phenazine biosynthesis protein
MKLSFTTIDAFTRTPYTGNPVAVIRVPASDKPNLTQKQKQSIASEFNLSEIVFLHLPGPGDESTAIAIDIFTAHAEVPFAGHPTIGSASYILNHLGQQNTTALLTKAGRIPIEKDVRTGEVKAVIPHAFHLHAVTFQCPLVQEPAETASIVNGMSFILVPLPDLPTLAQARANLQDNTYDPSPLDEGWRNGILATMYFVPQGEDAFGRKKYRTRMFGSREDPGTGSASCALGCYLAGKEPAEKNQGPFRFVFEQGVEMGRRNEIAVEVVRGEGGVGIEKVVLSGAAVEVMEGTLLTV